MHGLLLRIKARAEKVIGTPGNPHSLRPDPVLGKVRVDVVDPIGCLDKGEPHTAGGDGRPVHVALVVGHVDASEAVRLSC